MYSDFSGMLLENKYRIKEKIGKGGFACVYRITDEHIHKDFAMKMIVLDEDKISLKTENGTEAQKMLGEVRLLRQLEHSGLPQLHDVFIYESIICIVMELILGDTLDTYVAEHGKISEKEAWEIGKQIAEILRYLHSQSIPVIYTDLKPGNIMFHQGRVHMVDLGGAFYQFSKEKYFYATRGYAAPELENGESSVGSDIYSFGRVMLFLLTGRHPFLIAEEGIKRTLKRYGVSRSLRKIIEKCLNHDPAKRFRSGYELMDCINRKKGRKRGKSGNALGCGYNRQILECECSLFVSQGI